MDLKEIINRPNETPIQEDEACFVIAEYVKARKGQIIKPVIERRLGKMYAIHEVQVMHEMLNYAIAWFRENLDEKV